MKREQIIEILEKIGFRSHVYTKPTLAIHDEDIDEMIDAIKSLTQQDEPTTEESKEVFTDTTEVTTSLTTLSQEDAKCNWGMDEPSATAEEWLKKHKPFTQDYLSKGFDDVFTHEKLIEIMEQYAQHVQGKTSAGESEQSQDSKDIREDKSDVLSGKNVTNQPT